MANWLHLDGHAYYLTQAAKYQALHPRPWSVDSGRFNQSSQLDFDRAIEK